MKTWRSGLYGGRSESQSFVGARAAPPLKRGVLWPPLFVMLLLFAFVVGARTIPQPGSVPIRPLASHAGRRVERGSRRPVAAAPQVVWTEETRVAALGRLGLAFAVLGAIPMLLLIRAVRWNVMGYPKALREWQLLFLCRGCGQVFRAPEIYEDGLLRQR